MEQFCYTSCRGGQSVTGADGWRVRAVSDGITEQQARAYERLFRYSSCPSDRSNTVSGPTKLAFIIEPRRMLIHSVPAGLDPTTGRPGNYFAHVITDLPDSFTAIEAISAWGSPEWIASDFAGVSQLPPLAEAPQGSLVADDAVTFLGDATRRRWAGFCIQALLAADDSRLYLAGPPETLVNLILIGALCLPPRWRRGLSFSTYEPEPGSVKVRITGTSLMDPAKDDLPDYCYKNGRYGLNTYADRATPLGHSRYAERALGILAERGAEAVCLFTAEIDAFGAATPDDLDMLAGVLPTPDSVELLDSAIASPLTNAAKEAIIAAAVRAGSPLPRSAVTHLRQQHGSLVRLLPVLLASREHSRTIEWMRSRYLGLAWAERVLDIQEHIPCEVVKGVVHYVLDNYGAADWIPFCERNIERLSARAEFAPLLSRYIESLSPERAVTKSATLCCRRIYRLRHRLPGATVLRCRAFLDIARFLTQPFVSTSALFVLDRAMRRVPLDGQVGCRIASTIAGMVSQANWPAFASFMNSCPRGVFTDALLARLCRRLLASPEPHADKDLLPAAIALATERGGMGSCRQVTPLVTDAVALNPALRVAVFRRLSDESPIDAIRFIRQSVAAPHRLEMLTWVAQMPPLPRTEILRCLVRVVSEDLHSTGSWRVLHEALSSLLCLLETPAAPATLPIWEAYVGRYATDRCGDPAGAKNLEMLRDSHAPMQVEMNERLTALCAMSQFLLAPVSHPAALAAVGCAFVRLRGSEAPTLIRQLVRAIISVSVTARDAGKAIDDLVLPESGTSATVLTALIVEVIDHEPDGHMQALRAGLIPVILGAEALPAGERIELTQRIWAILSRAERRGAVEHSRSYAGVTEAMWKEAVGFRGFGGLRHAMGLGRWRRATAETQRTR